MTDRNGGQIRAFVPFVRLLDEESRRHLARVRHEPRYWRVVDGECLEPYLVRGDVVLIDFEREPVDGSIVLAAMKYRRGGGGICIGRASSAAMPVRVEEAVKQLRIVDGEAMLCASEGSVYASAHEILGVIVAWYRPGWWRRPSPREMRFAPDPPAPVPSDMAICDDPTRSTRGQDQSRSATADAGLSVR